MKQVTALPKIVWKKGMRILVKYLKSGYAYLGTVTSIKSGFIYLECDDGDKLKIKPDSKYLLGIGVWKKHKDGIPLDEAENYLSPDYLPKDTKVGKTGLPSDLRKYKGIPVKRFKEFDAIWQDIQKTYGKGYRALSSYKSNIESIDPNKPYYSISLEPSVKSTKEADKFVNEIRRLLKKHGFTITNPKEERTTMYNVRMVTYTIKPYDGTFKVFYPDKASNRVIVSMGFPYYRNQKIS